MEPDRQDRQTDSRHRRLERFGETALAPLLYGFVRWIDAQAARSGTDRLLFLARDGFLIEAAYAIAGQGRAARYMPISRHLVALMDQTPETLRDPGRVRCQPGLSTADWLEVYCAVPRPVAEAAARAGTRRGALDVIGPADLARGLEAQRAAARTFWQGFLDGASVPCVVDIGYRGTSQRALERMFRRPVGGLYLATFAGAGEGARMEAYAARGVRPSDSTVGPCRYRLIYELLLSDPAPSSGPVFDPARGPVPLPGTAVPDDAGCLSAIRAGALKGVADLARQDAPPPDASCATRALDRCLARPDATLARDLAGLRFADPLAAVPVRPLIQEDPAAGFGGLWWEGARVLAGKPPVAPAHPRRDRLAALLVGIGGGNRDDRAAARQDGARFLGTRPERLAYRLGRILYPE